MGEQARLVRPQQERGQLPGAVQPARLLHQLRGARLGPHLLNEKYPTKRDVLDYGNYFFVKGKTSPIYDYNVRTYQGNLLTQLGPLYEALNGKPDNPNAPVNPITNPEVQC